MSKKEHVQVFCRLRPSTEADASTPTADAQGLGGTFLSAVAADDGSCFETFDSETGDCVYRPSTGGDSKKFTFDSLFGPGSTQDEVYGEPKTAAAATAAAADDADAMHTTLP